MGFVVPESIGQCAFSMGFLVVNANRFQTVGAGVMYSKIYYLQKVISRTLIHANNGESRNLASTGFKGKKVRNRIL